MIEEEYNPTSDPAYVHSDWVHNYSAVLYPQFEALIKRFLFLKEGEDICGENMSITCIEKDNDNTILLWNHFQNSERHLIEVNHYKDFFDIQMVSNRYRLPEKKKRSYMVKLSFKELVDYYTLLYYAYGWLQQLKEEL